MPLPAGGGSTPRHTPAGGPSRDKRFDAPEWHANPVYRTLKDMYLLASDFLLKEGEAEDWSPPSASGCASISSSSSTRPARRCC